MLILQNIVIVGVTFIIMECVTWFTHKYIMHGFLWFFHRDHHQQEHGFFEKNDTFFLIFAIPSFLLMLFGSWNEFDYKFFIGLGIASYGLGYFFVHDIFIHQRIKILRISNSKYFWGLRRAHKVHHKHLNKDKGECYGMLWVPFKYFSQQKNKII